MAISHSLTNFLFFGHIKKTQLYIYLTSIYLSKKYQTIYHPTSFPSYVILDRCQIRFSKIVIFILDDIKI
eukprot:UN02207